MFGWVEVEGIDICCIVLTHFKEGWLKLDHVFKDRSVFLTKSGTESHYLGDCCFVGLPLFASTRMLGNVCRKSRISRNADGSKYHDKLD